MNENDVKEVAAVSKELGKIDMAEFGSMKAYPFMFGLQLGFSLNGGASGVCDGGKYTVNLSDGCKWKSAEEKNEAFEKVLKFVKSTLEAAKVNYVSELIGKPVEVELEYGHFKSFRILTEVL